jgi:hypothetical protein
MGSETELRMMINHFRFHHHNMMGSGKRGSAGLKEDQLLSKPIE